MERGREFDKTGQKSLSLPIVSDSRLNWRFSTGRNHREGGGRCVEVIGRGGRRIWEVDIKVSELQHVAKSFHSRTRKKHIGRGGKTGKMKIMGKG